MEGERVAGDFVLWPSDRLWYGAHLRRLAMDMANEPLLATNAPSSVGSGAKA
jgi:hypothetical protein